MFVNTKMRNGILEKLTKLCTDLRLSVYISEECDDDKLDVLIYYRESNEFVNRLIFDINKLKDGYGDYYPLFRHLYKRVVMRGELQNEKENTGGVNRFNIDIWSNWLPECCKKISEVITL